MTTATYYRKCKCYSRPPWDPRPMPDFGVHCFDENGHCRQCGGYVEGSAALLAIKKESESRVRPAPRGIQQAQNERAGHTPEADAEPAAATQRGD